LALDHLDAVEFPVNGSGALGGHPCATHSRTPHKGGSAPRNSLLLMPEVRHRPREIYAAAVTAAVQARFIEDRGSEWINA
jgi:hypothetical protein